MTEGQTGHHSRMNGGLPSSSMSKAASLPGCSRLSDHTGEQTPVSSRARRLATGDISQGVTKYSSRELKCYCVATTFIAKLGCCRGVCYRHMLINMSAANHVAIKCGRSFVDRAIRAIGYHGGTRSTGSSPELFERHSPVSGIDGNDHLLVIASVKIAACIDTRD